MRQHKFRGRRLDNGEWVEGLPAYDEYCEQISQIEIPNKAGDTVYPILVEVDPATVGEWTGLKDKNGKDIWEGDKVRYHTGIKHYGQPEYLIGEIVYDTKKAQFNIADWMFDLSTHFLDLEVVDKEAHQ